MSPSTAGRPWIHGFPLSFDQQAHRADVIWEFHDLGLDQQRWTKKVKLGGELEAPSGELLRGMFEWVIDVESQTVFQRIFKPATGRTAESWSSSENELEAEAFPQGFPEAYRSRATDGARVLSGQAPGTLPLFGAASALELLEELYSLGGWLLLGIDAFAVDKQGQWRFLNNYEPALHADLINMSMNEACAESCRIGKRILELDKNLGKDPSRFQFWLDLERPRQWPYPGLSRRLVSSNTNAGKSGCVGALLGPFVGLLKS